MQNDLIALTSSLIQCPSVTPEDKGCFDILIPRLKKMGFSVELFPSKNASNLWARLGTEAPLFCFAGHTDVVPTGDVSAWSHDPFTATLEGNCLYGRGAADMKSGLAAMIIAVEKFLATHSLQGSLAFLLTSAEEGPSHLGTPVVINALEKRNEKIDYCLVGEPTSEHSVGDTLKIGRRGSLNARLTIQGKQGHIAYPHLAKNPIHLALPALTALTQVIWDQGDEYFEPTSLQISNIQAGTGAENVIPDTLECQFNFRFSPQQTVEHLKNHTEALLKKYALDYCLEWTLSGLPFMTAPGKLIDACQQSIEQTTGKKARCSTGGGTSDARFIAPTGAEVVELGVVNKTIHQVNEYVKIDDLIKLTLFYQAIIEKILLST